MKFKRLALLSIVLVMIALTFPVAFGCDYPYGKVTGGGQCITPSSKKIPAASFGFNAMSPEGGPVKGEIDYQDLTTGKHVHVHDVNFIHVWEYEEGNKPWPLKKAEFGGPDVYTGDPVYVYVEDHGEPGKDDRFYIELDGMYLGGSKTVPMLSGNIQIHKPPYGNQPLPVP